MMLRYSFFLFFFYYFNKNENYKYMLEKEIFVCVIMCDHVAEER